MFNARWRERREAYFANVAEPQIWSKKDSFREFEVIAGGGRRLARF